LVTPFSTAFNADVPFNGGITWTNVAIDATDDVDMWRIGTLSTGERISIDADARSIGLSDVDTILRVFNSSGTQIAVNDDDGSTLDSRISNLLIPTSGTYYVGVSSYSNFSYNPLSAPSGSGSSTGAYRISFSRNDGSAPNVTANSPGSSGPDSGNYVFTWTASDPDSNLNQVTAQLRRGTTVVRSQTVSGSSGSLTLFGTDLPNGSSSASFSLHVTATDTFGNTTTTTSNSFTLFDDDATAPSINFTNATSQPDSANNVVSWSITDASGIASRSVLLRRLSDNSVLFSSTSSNSGSFNLNGLPPGTYRIEATATDADNDRSGDSLTSSNTETFSIFDDDTQGPLIVLGGSVGSESHGLTQAYTWSVSDPSEIAGTSVVIMRNGSTIHTSSAPSGSFNFDSFGVGDYVIEVASTDVDNDWPGDASSRTASRTVTVTNADPVAIAGADQTVDEGTTVVFDGSGSTDADGDALIYAWSFGDGNTGNGATASHVYADNGTYTVTLTVSDGFGGSHSDMLKITVENVAPTVQIAGAASAEVAVSLVRDINAGTGGSAIQNLTDVNGTLFFVANDGIHGFELWKSDGTTAGTVLVKDIQAGAASGSPGEMIAVGNTLYFWADDGVDGRELWKSDGTSSGTLLVKDISPGAGASFPGYVSSFVNAQGTLIFAANDGSHGVELWRTDGTPGGTVMLTDIFAGAIGSSPQQLTVVGSEIFFVATDASNGRALWKTDGSASGTVMIKDIRPGLANPFISSMTEMEGVAYFAADDGISGAELWRSDGSSAGTYLVKDINSGAAWSSPSSLTAVGDTLYFSADNGVVGAELWKTDGSAAGTQLVQDVRPGSGSSNPDNLTALGSKVLFRAFDNATGTELWISDGTGGGTGLVKDIQPGANPSGPQHLRELHGRIIFVASNSTGGSELWQTDGTASGTQLVSDIRPGTTGSIPQFLTVSNGRIFFRADDGASGQELWSVQPVFGSQTMINEGTSVLTTGSFHDPGSDTWVATVDYGDGSGLQPLALTGNAFTLSHLYSDNGTYTITVAVTDDDGGGGSATLEVTVANVAPTPSIDVISATRLEGTQIDVTASATDPAGASDTLTYSYAVFKDGSTTPFATGGGVELTSFSFTPDDNGSYEIVLTVSDEDGGSAQASQMISVANVAPTPVIDQISATRLEGTQIDVTASATDPAGASDTLTYSYEVFKDGASTPFATGSGVDLTSFSFTPDDNGSYEIVLTVSDEDGGSAQASQMITVENAAPTVAANNAAVVVDEGQTATNSGTYGDVGADTVTLSASIGTLVDHGDGTWSWSWDTSDGPDQSQTVTITATDSDGAETETSFQLTVNNVAPTIDDVTFEVVENSVNGTLVGTVTGTDPGDDTLTYSITGGSGATAFAIDAITGEITVADASQLDFETDMVFTLEVTATDDEGASGTATVTINLLNLASLTGAVFVDVDQDGLYDASETGIDGVTVELLDEAGIVVATAITESGGMYMFEDVAPGTYRIRELQPTGVSDGAEQLGSLGGTIVANDLMQVTLERTDAADYNFAEIGQSVSSGDTATIGFWQNKHGQALIEQGGTALAEWLTNNFGNVFGDEFVGADGADVAAFYKDQLFKQKAKKSAGPAKVDAQFMAVAFATFFTSRTLAGEVAADYGFHVTDTGIGTKIVNVGNSGAAFGVADNTDRTILQLLLATNALTDVPDGQAGFASIYDQDGDGVIDFWESTLRSQANEIFSLINEEGDI
jgi:ELWxxDGT repeat protein